MVVGSQYKKPYNDSCVLAYVLFCSVSQATSESLALPTTYTLSFYLSDPRDATVAPMGRTIANRSRLRVLAQCKAEKKKMGPAYLRELEGVVYRYAAVTSTSTSTDILQPNPSESESESESDSPRVPQAVVPNDDPAAAKELPPIALLVSESAFTRHCLLAAHASPLPFLLVHLPPLPPPLPPPSNSTSTSTSTNRDGGSSSAIGAVFGNPALVSAKGVLGGELEIRWERGGSDGDSGVPTSQSQSGMLGGAGAGRPRLWWQGQPLPSWTPEPGADVDCDGVVL